MKKKRKISYSELRPPDARPDARPGVPPDAPPPETADGESEPPRRRRADRAESPRELATALNERLAHERGAPPPPVPAAGPVVVEPAAAELVASRDSGGGEAGRMSAEQVASDTMEFAVSSATMAIPFRERARARAGSVELLLFRVGHELFAAPLASVEEAVELPVIRHLPEMADDMLGMFALRGRMMPIYSPSRPLGVSLGAAPTAALVMRAGAQRVALAVDDVDDVLDLDLGTLRDAPGVEDADGILLGVARRGHDLVAVLDGDALVTACLTDRPLETS